jgi:hypothetical protein
LGTRNQNVLNRIAKIGYDHLCVMEGGRHVSGITFMRYAEGQNTGKPNNLKVFGNKKSECPKQDSQNRLRSPVWEGRSHKFDHNYNI